MTQEANRKQMGDLLRTIADDIENLPNNPFKNKTSVIIDEMYQVMRKLSDYQEINY